MNAMFEMSMDYNWQIIPYAMEDDLEAMFDEMKTKKVKNILFYAGFEENIKPIINAVSTHGICKQDIYRSFYKKIDAISNFFHCVCQS